MGRKEPLVEKKWLLKKNSTYNWNLKLPNIQMDTIERKQRYNVPCAISCQGTFVIEFH